MKKHIFLFALTLLFACQSEKSNTPNNATNNVSANTNSTSNIATANTNTLTESAKTATQEPTSKPAQMPAVLPMPNGTQKIIPQQQRVSPDQKQTPTTQIMPQTTKVEAAKPQQPTTKTPPIVAQYYMAVGEKAPNQQKIACYTQAAAKFGLEFIATGKSLPQHQKANKEATELMIKRWGNDWNRQFEEAVSNCLVANERK